MKGSSTILCAILTLLGTAVADFDLYTTSETIIPGEEGVVMGWLVTAGNPDCDGALNAPFIQGADDVSGTRQGIRCDGSCQGGDNPEDINVLEMNWDENHFTIYKDRNWEMVDLDGNSIGNCTPDGSNTFDCTDASVGIRHLSGTKKFTCITSITADDINN